ncbi:lactonase family protein [Paenibacillus mendelii]|uniref:Lactonase family protein n=1 Tax=Paenibacillus mendelii TaxID=206163 RepID=A0ABV6J7A1_9BACL|nr:lactonase family protein [Paenibacillus mendelii]MCQ6562105.1 lactonase family protein [Paenibacillus mendelii]
MTAKQKPLFIFTGSYAEPENSGVYVYSFNEENGQLTLLDQVGGLKNPTFLDVDAERKVLYSIGERQTPEGSKTAEAAAFAIDERTGKLSLLNREHTVPAPTCHIQRDIRNPLLVVSSYHGGMIGLVALREDGQVGELLDTKQHEGHSVHPNQDRPHPHSAFFSPNGRFVFIQDLGIDRIRSYSIDAQRGVLTLHGEATEKPGAGPRHLAFHPEGAYAFVINELNSSITSYSYDAEQGQLTAIETVPTLPEDYNGDNSCAEINVSEDGRFVYGSNRGHDSIVVYAFNSITGKLSLVEHVSVEGSHPRNFALTPGGQYLIAANRDTNNIVTFRVDQESGKLHYTGNHVEVSKPVCVRPVRLG